MEMLEAGASPGSYTFPNLLKPSAHLSSPHISAFFSDKPSKQAFRSTSLHKWLSYIVTYSVFGYVELAPQVFDKMSQKDLVACNSTLDEYTSRGLMENATELFNSMPLKDRFPEISCCWGVRTSDGWILQRKFSVKFLLEALIHGIR